MKILIITDSSVPSSYRISRADILARGFTQIGHQVSVLCSRPILSEDLEKKGYEKIKLIYIPKFEQRSLVRRGQHFLWLTGKLAEILKSEKFDILRPIALIPGFVTIRSNKYPDYPVMTSLTDFYSDFYRQLDLPFASFVVPFLRYMEKKIVQGSDTLVVDSPCMRELWKKWGLEERKSVVLPHGIDAAMSGERDVQQIRKKYSLNDKKVVMFHGDIGKSEGLDILVKAVGLLAKKETDIRVMIVGEGPSKYMKYLRTLIAERNLADYFIFTGWIAHKLVPDYLAVADIYVHSCRLNALTTYSNVPNKVLEYIAMNKPIIATSAPGLKSMFSDALQYVPDDSPEKLAEAIFAVLNTPELRAKLSQKTEKFRSGYLWDKIVSQEEKIMYALLENRNTDFRQLDWQLTNPV